MSYALYNLSYRIRSLYPEMFSNSMPHKPEPNSDWKHILFLLRQLRFSSDQWNSITHKQLYLSLLDSKQAELPKINSCLKPSSCSEVLLLSKIFPKSRRKWHLKWNILDISSANSTQGTGSIVLQMEKNELTHVNSAQAWMILSNTFAMIARYLV